MAGRRRLQVTIHDCQEDTTTDGRGGGGPNSNVDGLHGGDKGSGALDAPAAHSGDNRDPNPNQYTSPYTDPDAGLGLLNVVTSPAFPLAGRATFPTRATSAATMTEGCYGMGFDAYLLTKDHVPITGSCTFYMPGGVPQAGRPGPTGCSE